MAAARVSFIEDGLAAALELAQGGLNQPDGVVVFPTDTVYGLLALAEHPAAYRRIFALKARPPDQPLQLLCSRESSFFQQARAALATAPEIASQFEQGRATVVFPAKTFRGLPPEVTVLQPGAVGLRAPDYPPLDGLWRRLGPEQLLWATSANSTGASPITTAEAALAWASTVVPPLCAVVLTRATLPGQPSAVVRLSDGGILRM